MQLNNLGLITYTENGRETSLGYLLDFSGRGVYSPNGKVDVTKEKADAHNLCLAQAEIDGLDKSEIGQWGTFYYKRPNRQSTIFWNGRVTTFTGKLVSANISINGKSIKFWRGKKQFRGILRKDMDCFNFKRIK